MSPLRKQLEDDLAIRGMSERTRETYVGAVAALAKHYGRSPDRIGQEEIQRYLLHLLTERKLAPSSCNVAASTFSSSTGSPSSGRGPSLRCRDPSNRRSCRRSSRVRKSRGCSRQARTPSTGRC